MNLDWTIHLFQIWKNIRLYHNKFNRKPFAFDDFNKREFSEEEKKISQDNIECLKEKADKGELDSVYKYGLMLKSGKNVPVNKKEAKKYIKIAANNWNTDAMVKYANMLIEEYHTKPNKEELLETLKIHADNGDPRAMFFCGTLFFSN